jgi:hypothetical protein
MRKSIITGLTLCAAMGAGHARAFAKKPVDTAHGHPIAKAEMPDLVSFQPNFEYRRTHLFMTACTSPSRSAPGVLVA